jgi:hypothetical protein
MIALLNRLLLFLQKNRWLNLVLVLAYTVFILHGHDTFVQLSVVVMNKLSLQVYNDRVMQLMMAAAAFFLLSTLYQLYRQPQRWRTKLTFLFLCFGALGLHVALLFEMNIEIIHVAEFTLLVLLLFPFSRSIGASLVYALPIMIADELNQYLVLYPNYNKYFELSDIVLDLLGAGTLLLLLHIGGLSLQKAERPWLKQPAVVLLLTIITSATLGLLTKLFVFTPDEVQAHTVFVFNRLEQPELFWQVHSFTGAKYHVLLPYEGIALVFLVCTLFIAYEKLVLLPNK